jgi:multidrug efflux pump
MTEKVNDDVRQYFQTQEKDNVDAVFTVMGFNFGGRAQNAGIAFIDLKDFDQRPNASQSAQAVTRRALAHFRNYNGAIVTPFMPPAVIELGNATGFDFELEDRGHLGHAAVIAARNQLLKLASQDPRLVAMRPNGLEDAPQVTLEIDREKADAMGVSMADINTTVQDPSARFM